MPFVLLLLFLLLSSCSPHGDPVTKEMYGSAWPFTVEEGHLECLSYAVLFHADGKTYLLQGDPGRIREEMAGEPLHDLGEIWRRQDAIGDTWSANMPLDTLIASCSETVSSEQ